MAEKFRIVKIVDGEDKGKVFRIEKMHAEPLEDWAFRAFLAAARSKVDIPPEIVAGGLAGMVEYGFKGLFSQLHIDELRPLLAEMFECIQIISDPAHPEFSRPLHPDDIETVSTRLKLRKEWIELHTGFSIPDVIFKLTPTSGQTGPSITQSM